MKQKALNIILYIIVFIASLYQPTDSDLGWKLKYGEYFWQNHQVLSINIFSSMMPNYYWVNNSWATDVVTYIVYSKFDFLGLAILGSTVITLTFYFFSKAARLSLWNKMFLFPVLLYLLEPLTKESFRPQFLSLLFLSILFYFLNEYYSENRSKIYFAIPLFLVWSNFHGEYILGLGILFIWTIFYTVKKWSEVQNDRKELFFGESAKLGAIFIASSLAVLINPFGAGVYTESFKHFLNPNLKFIAEWIPLPLFSIFWWKFITIGVLVSVSFFYLWSVHKIKDRLTFIIIVIILFVFGFFASRYVWRFYLFAIPFLAILTDLVAKQIKENYQKLVIPSGILLLALTVLIIKAPFRQYSSMSWDSYCDVRKCSTKAAEFLIANHLNKNNNLLTKYGLGGWLIWNYPQIRPTIDGRMVVWRDEKGYSAFREYIAVENNWVDIDKSQYTVVFTNLINRPFLKRLVELTKTGKWKILYNDKYTAIFEKVS